MVQNYEPYQKPQTYHRYFLKKTLQFLLPLFLLSYLLSYSSVFSGFLNYFNFQFSTLLFPLFSHTIDRKYMFLICNGIVVFLVKISGFSSSPIGLDFNDEFAKTKEAEVKLVHKSSGTEAIENKKATMGDIITSPENVGTIAHNEATMEGNIGSPENVRHEKEEEENDDDDVNLNTIGGRIASPENVGAIEDNKPTMGGNIASPENVGTIDYREATMGGNIASPENVGTIAHNEATMGGNIGSPENVGHEKEEQEQDDDDDELNRKFDEFIRKMKKEIRNGATPQLIAV